MIKIRSWEKKLILLVVIPVLKKVRELVALYVSQTENKYDDAVVGVFDVVISILTDGDIFMVQDK